MARFLARRLSPIDRPLLLSLLFLGAAAQQEVWRSDLPHLLQALGGTWVPAAHVAYHGGRRLLEGARVLAPLAPLPRPARALVVVLPATLAVAWAASFERGFRDPRAAAAMAAARVGYLPSQYTGSPLVRGGEKVLLPFDRARLWVDPLDARRLTRFYGAVVERTRPGDPVVCLPGLQLLYFLSDRPNPTRYLHVRRAFDSEEEEERYVRDLARAAPRLIIVQDTPIDGRPERRFRLFAPRVWAWILGGYRPVGELDDALVFVPMEAGP